MEQPILNPMPDDRKAKSVGFLFYYLYTVLCFRFNEAQRTRIKQVFFLKRWRLRSKIELLI